MQKITADRIFTGTGEILENHVIILDEEGRILSVDDQNNHNASEINHLRGTLVPGFVNTHCHLELSHMKGVIPTGTGLVPFISKVVQLRDFPPEVIEDAIAAADEEMNRNGIVAVGDICNKPDTARFKEKSNIAYYSFVEMFDFLQDDKSVHFFDQFYPAFEKQANTGLNKKCIVPHAPYSVSQSLFKKINKANAKNQTISIHNQECAEENLLFASKEGPLVDFFTSIGMSLDHFEPTGATSLAYAIENLDNSQRTLFVHNTMSEKKDIKMAEDWNTQCYWATCPNANLYIENHLPDYSAFIDLNAKMTLGTDSLSSNWQLDIWEEIKTIKKYNSYIDLKTLLTWATINGAEALGYGFLFGSIEKGKQPGLNLIDLILGENDQNIQHVSSRKII